MHNKRHGLDYVSSRLFVLYACLIVGMILSANESLQGTAQRATSLFINTEQFNSVVVSIHFCDPGV